MTRFAVIALALAGCYTSSTTTASAPPVAQEDPPKKKRRPRPEPAATCDEVSCVLGNYEAPCCAKFRKRPIAAPQQTGLDRHQIQAAIAAVRPQITACANTGIKGTVKVAVQVAPDGSITQARVTSSPDPAIDACVLAAIAGAVFPATGLGGSFAYPFVF